MNKTAKKIIGLVLLLIFIQHNSFAIDGYFWETVAVQEKEAYIAGLIDGALSFGAEALFSVEDQTTKTVIDNLMDDYDLKKEVPVNDIIKVLDRFYEEHANKKIWVSEAYKIALKMIRGCAEPELQKEIKFLRSKSNQ